MQLRSSKGKVRGTKWWPYFSVLSWLRFRLERSLTRKPFDFLLSQSTLENRGWIYNESLQVWRATIVLFWQNSHITVLLPATWEQWEYIKSRRAGKPYPTIQSFSHISLAMEDSSGFVISCQYCNTTAARRSNVHGPFWQAMHPTAINLLYVSLAFLNLNYLLY